MTLQKTIGLNLFGVLECSSLRMRAMNVVFKEGIIQWRVLDSSTTYQTSSLIRSKNLWKKLEVKPSGLGAFPSLSCFIADSTSGKETGHRSNWLCSSVITFRMCRRIFSIAGYLLIWGSWWTALKCLRSSFSIFSCPSNWYPYWFWIWVMLLCIRLCMVVRWKNFVILLPSFNHLIQDFCFQRISSCFSLFAICVWRFFSCSKSSSVLPSVMIVCRIFSISWARAFWAWKMFPKVARFHYLMCTLRNLSFCWNWNIFEPAGGRKLFHVDWIRSLKFGCVSHNDSKRKGFRVEFPGLCHWGEMGQWSDPESGKIEDERYPPMWITLFEIRNLSNREAICWVSDLLLFQV